MGEALRGTGITYLRKPPATLLGMETPLDEDAVTACFRKTAEARAAASSRSPSATSTASGKGCGQGPAYRGAGAQALEG